MSLCRASLEAFRAFGARSVPLGVGLFRIHSSVLVSFIVVVPFMNMNIYPWV
jgi:hypothetical protein